MQATASARASHWLLIAGLLATAVALVSGAVRSAVFDSERFGEHAAQVVRDPAVREQLATSFTDRLIEVQPQALSARPKLISIAEGVLAGQLAGNVVAAAASQTQRALLTADEPSLVLDFADFAVVVSALARSQNIDLPASLDPEQLEVTRAISSRAATADLIRLGRSLATVAHVSTALAIALILLAMALARDRQRALLRLGGGLLAVAVAVLALALLARSIALAELSPASRDLWRAIFDSYGADLVRWSLLLAALGAVLTASAASLVGTVQIGDVPRRAWLALTRVPQRPSRRLLRGAVLIAAGLLVVRAPDATLTLVGTVVGAYLAILGLMSVLAAFPSAARGPGAATQPSADAPSRGLLRPAPILAAAAVLVLPSLAVGQLLTDDPVKAVAASDARACNGDVALCDRRLDHVVFASSHNANTTAADGFLNANHGAGMLAQLDLGIRGLLIDTAPGSRNADGVVRTDLEGATREEVVQQIGEDGLSAAQRLGGRIAFGPLPAGAERRLYLCHVLCEMGAVDAIDALREIRDWVAAHPREVLVIFVQDDSPRAMTLDALRRSGLAEYAATLSSSAAELPTLGELIEQDKRVVLLAENHPGGEPWWLDGFRVFQETPFGFPTPQALMAESSCRANRGGTQPPMLLVNHWVETYPPRPRNADVASRANDLLRRARRCWRERERVPNLLAVDFVERTGVMEAAAVLNREVGEQLEAGADPARGPAAR